MEEELQPQSALEEKRISQGPLMDGVVSGSEKVIGIGDSVYETSSGEGEEPVTVIPNKCNTEQGPVGISQEELEVNEITMIAAKCDINTQNERQTGVARVQSEHPFTPVARVHHGFYSESESFLKSSCKHEESCMDNKSSTVIPPVEHSRERDFTALENEEEAEVLSFKASEKSTEEILANPELKEAICQEIEEIWTTALQKCGMDEESRQNQVARKVDTLVLSGSEFLDMSCPQYRPTYQNYGDREISVRASEMINLKAKPSQFGIGLDVLKLMEAVEECTQTLNRNECFAEIAPSYFLSDLEPDVILEGEILEMSPDDFCLTTRTIPLEDEYEYSELELCDLLIEEGDIMEITDPQETYTTSLLGRMSDTSFYNTFESYANDLMPSNQDVLPDDDSDWIGNYQRPKSAASIDDEVDISALEESNAFEEEDICVMDNASDFCEHFELRSSFSEEDANVNVKEGNETESVVPVAIHECDVSDEVDFEAMEACCASHEIELHGGPTSEDSSDKNEVGYEEDVLKEQGDGQNDTCEVKGMSTNFEDHLNLEFDSGFAVQDSPDNKDGEEDEFETNKVVWSHNCTVDNTTADEADTDAAEESDDPNHGENDDRLELEEFSDAENEKTTDEDETSSDELKLKIVDYVDNEVSDGDNSQIEVVDTCDETCEESEKAGDFGDYVEFGSVIGVEGARNEKKSELGKIASPIQDEIAENDKRINVTHSNAISGLQLDVSDDLITGDKSEDTVIVNGSTKPAQKPVVKRATVEDDQEERNQTISVTSMDEENVGVCIRIGNFFNRIFRRQGSSPKKSKTKADDPAAALSPSPPPPRTLWNVIRHLFSGPVRVVPMDSPES